MVSEVTTNAVQHIRSGQPGGHFTLTLRVEGGRVRAEIEDEGSAAGDVPHVEVGEDWEAEHGRGLAVVDALADKHGVERPNVVWFELTWGEEPQGRRERQAAQEPQQRARAHHDPAAR